jgi:hypothetical protein
VIGSRDERESCTGDHARILPTGGRIGSRADCAVLRERALGLGRDLSRADCIRTRRMKRRWQCFRRGSNCAGAARSHGSVRMLGDGWLWREGSCEASPLAACRGEDRVRKQLIRDWKSFDERDGSDVIQLTSSGGIDAPLRRPAVADRLCQCARWRQRDLRNEPRRIRGRPTTRHAFDSFPVWSPDGRRIAASGRDGNTEIYTMNADGSGVTRLTLTALLSTLLVSWKRQDRLHQQSHGQQRDLRMKADGTDVVRMYNSVAFEGSPQVPGWDEDRVRRLGHN